MDTIKAHKLITVTPTAIIFCGLLKNFDFELFISHIPVQHVEDMDCYGYVIKYKDISIYYSGDAKDIPEDILQRFENHELNYLYQDVCSYDDPNSPHMHIKRLYELVQEKDRNRLFCMHYDEGSDKTKIQQMGFKLVRNLGE